MQEWLSKIDPNTVVGILVAVFTVAYHLARRDAKGSLMSQLEGLGKQVVHVLVTDPQITSATSLQALKDLARSELRALAKKSDIPDNALTEVLIAQIVEQAVGEALAEMRTIDGATATLSAAPSDSGHASRAPKSKRHYRVAKVPVAALVVMMFGLATMNQGCDNPQVKTWTGTFAGCEKADLGQMVTVENVTTGLLTAIGYIVQGNFPSLESDLAQLATVVGFGTVRCAILAFEAAIATPSSGAASPQIMPPGLTRMKAWLVQQEAATK